MKLQNPHPDLRTQSVAAQKKTLPIFRALNFPTTACTIPQDSSQKKFFLYEKFCDSSASHNYVCKIFKLYFACWTPQTFVIFQNWSHLHARVLIIQEPAAITAISMLDTGSKINVNQVLFVI